MLQSVPHQPRNTMPLDLNVQPEKESQKVMKSNIDKIKRQIQLIEEDTKVKPTKKRGGSDRSDSDGYRLGDESYHSKS